MALSAAWLLDSPESLLDLISDAVQLSCLTCCESRESHLRLREGSFLALPPHSSQVAFQVAEIGYSGSQLGCCDSLQPVRPMAVVLQDQFVKETAKDP